MNLKRVTPLVWTLLWLIIGCQSIVAFVEGGSEAALTGGDDQQNDQNITSAMSQQLLNSFNLLIVRALNDTENRMEDKLSQLQNNVNDKMSLLNDIKNGIEDKLLANSCYRGMACFATKQYQPLELVRYNRLDRDILCDTQTDGGGWIVIQRRTKGFEYFGRDWAEYKNGFGMPPRDFWLGNEAIYEFTNKDTYELRIDFNNGTHDLFAMYSSFRLESEEDNYRLRLGSHSGTLGEENTDYGLSYHNGKPFSTYDRDNDDWSGGNCATNSSGAWWYDNCHTSNLNGHMRYRTVEGLRWEIGSAYIYGESRFFFASSTEMKMRRV